MEGTHPRATGSRRVYRQSQASAPLSSAPLKQIANVVGPFAVLVAVTFGISVQFSFFFFCYFIVYSLFVHVVACILIYDAACQYRFRVGVFRLSCTLLLDQLVVHSLLTGYTMFLLSLVLMEKIIKTGSVLFGTLIFEVQNQVLMPLIIIKRKDYLSRTHSTLECIK